jgi:hypothetical protein
LGFSVFVVVGDVESVEDFLVEFEQGFIRCENVLIFFIFVEVLERLGIFVEFLDRKVIFFQRQIELEFEHCVVEKLVEMFSQNLQEQNQTRQKFRQEIFVF